jgi:two-component system chemotaxis response regulator CheY
MYAMKSIVVDDSVSIVKLLVQILKNCNVEVVATGNNGNEAVKIYKSKLPDIVFLDVLMPNADGFFALKEIRKINPNAVIVFVTADPLIEHKLLEHNDVPSAVIQKPFEIAKITNVVTSISDSIPYKNIIQFQKKLIKIAIERTIIELGISEFEKIRQKLKLEYECGFEDCLVHPKFLKNVLCDLHGSSYEELVSKIMAALAGFLLHEPIISFLKVMTAKNA